MKDDRYVGVAFEWGSVGFSPVKVTGSFANYWPNELSLFLICGGAPRQMKGTRLVVENFGIARRMEINASASESQGHPKQRSALARS